MKRADRIVQGKYRCVGDEERIYLTDSTDIFEDRYVKINYASSGQQEVVWIINFLVYYLATNQKVFLIVEEPESHLYPESQRLLAEALSAFRNTANGGSNRLLITTHSPYILGSLNYMLLAGQCLEKAADDVKKEIEPHLWIRKDGLAAWFVADGHIENGLNEDDGLTLIKNELIDGASDEVNRLTDFVLEQESDDAD